MNTADVQNALEQIRKHAGDDEAAHALENALHTKLLASIADGTCDDPAACARLALTSGQIDFERWCG